MKLLIIFGICLSSFFQANGQDTLIFIRDYNQGQLGRLAYGLFFLPLDSDTKRLDSSAVFCPDYTRLYFLDGLKLSEEMFECENLFKGVTKEEGRYAFQFRDSDTTKCVEVLNFFLTINVPVVLNDIELKASETEKMLAEVRPEQIVSIKKRKTWLFGSTYLEILTR